MDFDKTITSLIPQERESYLLIPLNQRNYEWAEKEIDDFLNDLYDCFKEKTDFCTGMYILLKEERNKTKTISIWDGQQRTITIILFIVKVLNLLQLHSANVNFIRKKLDILTIQEDEIDNEGTKSKINEKHWTFVSKIKYASVNCEADNNLMTDFMHDRIRVSEDLIQGTEGQCNKSCICALCKKSFKREDDCKRHIDKHMCPKISSIEGKIVRTDKNNNIINAIKIITRKIQSWTLTSESLRRLLDFVFEKVKFDIEQCHDIRTVVRRFEYLNNRGKPVDILTIAKNQFISQSESAAEEKCIEDFFYKVTCLGRQYKDLFYGIDEKVMFELTLKIYHETFDVSTKLADLMILKDNVKLIEFFSETNSILERIQNICDIILRSELSYSLTHIKNDSLVYAIIPLSFYHGQDSIEPLMKILISHHVRAKSVIRRHPNYNWFEFLNMFNNMIVKAIITKEDGWEDTMQTIKKELWERSIKSYGVETLLNYQDKIHLLPEHIRSSQETIKFMLMFYVTEQKTRAVSVNVKELDLEHIRPKSSTNIDPKMLQRLGNCTLLESVNTKFQVGNRSIKNKTFMDKLPSFRNSALMLNRDLVQMFGKQLCFDESCIEKRECMLTEKLFKITEEYLRP